MPAPFSKCAAWSWKVLANWHDIGDATVWVTNMKKDFQTSQPDHGPEYFAGWGKPHPSRTTIEVGAL